MSCHCVSSHRDPESQADGDSQEVFKLAKDVLIQGLTDENPGLQYVPRCTPAPGPVGHTEVLSWPVWGL